MWQVLKFCTTRWFQAWLGLSEGWFRWGNSNILSFPFLFFILHFWIFIRTFSIPVNFKCLLSYFNIKKVCHEFQLDPTLHFATYWRIYVFLDLDLSSGGLSCRQMKSTYSTPLSQYLFCSCHKMFRLRHFEVGYIFRLYPISHSWNTLLLFQSLLVWFTAPLAIFWNEISWNWGHGPPKGSYSDTLYYSIRLFLNFSFSDATIVSTFWQSCPFEIKSILTICLSLPHYPVGQGEQTSFLSLSSPLFVFSTVSHFRISYIFLNTFSSSGSRSGWIVYEDISGVVWPSLALFVRELLTIPYFRYKQAQTTW